jgi:hypothetical protein
VPEERGRVSEQRRSGAEAAMGVHAVGDGGEGDGGWGLLQSLGGLGGAGGAKR